MKHRILMVDDEIEILDLVRIYLERENYEVLTARDGAEGMELFEKENPQLVILDIMMPKIDGLEVCRRIRQKSNLPIIMLSSKSEDMDKIIGLGIGADDYMVKPFNPMELVARVKSQLRRSFYFQDSIHKPKGDVITVKGLEINRASRSVKVFGNEVSLTPTEFEILYLLASNKGKVFKGEEIFEGVWKEKYFEANNTVMVHMWRLREKIEQNPKEPKIIETVWGVGYKIEDEKS